MIVGFDRIAIIISSEKLIEFCERLGFKIDRSIDRVNDKIIFMYKNFFMEYSYSFPIEFYEWGESMYKLFIKRLIDIILSFIGIIVLAIPMFFVAIAIKLDSKGPVFFKQQRLGRYGKVYTMYKFRSMCVGAEKDGVYSDGQDKRVSKVGKFIRATSIDELPQFFNTLVGSMSFVGPRPPMTYHPWSWEEYTDEQRRMFDVRPGITGWAQVNGRKGVEWNRRIEMNVWYVDHVSFWLDLKIMWLTVWKVVSNADNENTGATVTKSDTVEQKETVNK